MKPEYEKGRYSEDFGVYAREESMFRSVWSNFQKF